MFRYSCILNKSGTFTEQHNGIYKLIIERIVFSRSSDGIIHACIIIMIYIRIIGTFNTNWIYFFYLFSDIESRVTPFSDGTIYASPNHKGIPTLRSTSHQSEPVGAILSTLLTETKCYQIYCCYTIVRSTNLMWTAHHCQSKCYRCRMVYRSSLQYAMSMIMVDLQWIVTPGYWSSFTVSK